MICIKTWNLGDFPPIIKISLSSRNWLWKARPNLRVRKRGICVFCQGIISILRHGQVSFARPISKNRRRIFRFRFWHWNFTHHYSWSRVILRISKPKDITFSRNGKLKTILGTSKNFESCQKTQSFLMTFKIRNYR